MDKKYRSSIIHYSSVRDIQCILDELKEDLSEQFDEDTLHKLVAILDAKSNEVLERYNR